MSTLDFESFDLDVEEKQQIDTLPEGWYDAMIENVEVRTTKSGTGAYFAVTYNIVGNNYANRKVWGNVTYKNPNATAETIGRKQLSKMSAAGGLTSLPSDTDELIGLTMSIKVGVTPATDQYAARNEVKDWKSSGGGSPLPKAQETKSNAAPWAKH
jgi:hypothetical protein